MIGIPINKKENQGKKGWTREQVFLCSAVQPFLQYLQNLHILKNYNGGGEMVGAVVKQAMAVETA
jgi:hypothetical protein